MMEGELSERREEMEGQRRKLIGGNTPNSASSPPPFLSPSDRPGEEDEEEVQVAVVTEEATSGSSEAFCTAHLEGSANQSTQSEDRQEVMSPPSPSEASEIPVTDGSVPVQ